MESVFYFMAILKKAQHTSFWPRATLKGPKRSFVVVVVLLVVGVESKAKNVSKVTKSVSKQKTLANKKR